MTTILSLGAGVNSTAILALIKQGKIRCPEKIVFADTGCEHPETYQHLEYLKKYFYIDTVKREGQNLYGYYFEHKIIPTRMYRHCTDKFKIQPLKKYALQQHDAHFLIGFCKGEENRAKDFCLKTNVSFPLIELGLDRADCKRVIKEAGLPIPIKSGCYCCPFTKSSGWKWLNRTHPELFDRAVALEKNGSRYPILTLSHLPLEQVIQKHELCDWLGACSMCEVM